jgi:poly(hydroxyalkanoate) depolymerase family esterase
MLSLVVMAMVKVASFGANPGALDMFEHVPAQLPAGRPVVVVLHGCTQQASSMEATGWDKLADEHQFIVVYAQQRAANQQLNCFTWYAAADTTRANGEAASIAAMVDYTVATHGADAKRVYVTGMSAGGAFTAVMLATYPERFAAGSAMAGLPYACATSFDAASACTQMTSSAQKTPAQWGDLVRAASSHGGPWPRMQIWQGSADYTVAPANATEFVEQWTNVWSTDQLADETTAVGGATRTRYLAGQTAAVELFVVEGMGHAVATGDDPLGPCPATAGAFFANKGVCSTRHAAAFFGLLGTPPIGGDGTPSPDAGGGGGGGGGGCNAGGQPGLVLALLALTSARRRRRSACSSG